MTLANWTVTLGLLLRKMNDILVMKTTNVVETEEQEEHFNNNAHFLKTIVFERTYNDPKSVTLSIRKQLEEIMRNTVFPPTPKYFNGEEIKNYLRDKWEEVFFSDDTVFHPSRVIVT